MERLSRHSAILAKLADDGLKALRIRDADKKREDQKPPPGPMGTPAPGQRTGGSI